MMSYRNGLVLFVSLFGVLVPGPYIGSIKALTPRLAGIVLAQDAEENAILPQVPENGSVNQPLCAISTPHDPPAKLFAPPVKSDTGKQTQQRNAPQPNKGRSALSDDPTPTLQPSTSFCTQMAAERYRHIAEEGGWPIIPRSIGKDAAPEEVNLLRQRLTVEGDLHEEAAGGNGWDDALIEALKTFQRRTGLEQSGEVDEATLKALNVPADVRAHELEESAKRIATIQIPFDQRHVVVNIPSASVEAIENSRVIERHAAVAGDPDHPSPQLVALIRGITFNPTWTIPRSIIENEVIPKLKKDPNYLRRFKIYLLDRRGHEVRAHHIHWSSKKAAVFTFRQRPGTKNSLGTLRIDMPNSQAVYMHDTPSKRFFAADYRFLSHGCVRVNGVYDLAAWLMSTTARKHGHWDHASIEEAVKQGKQKRIALTQPIPVAWIYLDAWASADGMVHFRPDIYGLDGAGEREDTK